MNPDKWGSESSDSHLGVLAANAATTCASSSRNTSNLHFHISYSLTTGVIRLGVHFVHWAFVRYLAFPHQIAPCTLFCFLLSPNYAALNVLLHILLSRNKKSTSFTNASTTLLLNRWSLSVSLKPALLLWWGRAGWCSDSHTTTRDNPQHHLSPKLQSSDKITVKSVV